MLGISTGILSKLATALINGDENLIEKLIEKKLEDLGEDVIMQLIGGPLSAAMRASKAVETGGASEFNRLRSQWLSGLKPPSLPGAGTLGRMQAAFERNKHLLSRPEGKWQKWSKSRQDWLDESWKHDWRSQPRDPRTGEWVPGRLKHPYISKGARRLRLQRRKAARQAAREAMRTLDGD